MSETPFDDARRIAPAAARNVVPILAVLESWLPKHGTILEIASGTGEHALAFAQRFAGLDWQPSDPDPAALASIEAWRAVGQADNMAPPIALDASARRWPVARADGVIAINMVHISPWAASLGLLDGAGRLLERGAPLILYGPWIEQDIEIAQSNRDFDADLRARDPAWGLRDLGDFVIAAAMRDFDLAERRVMPANNLMLLFRRR